MILEAKYLRDEAHDKSEGRVAMILEQSTMKNSGLFGGEGCRIPTLTFLSGAALGKELPLVRQSITLGRGEESDVLILDSSVSRKHIRLTCRKLIDKSENQEMRVLLEDLGSKNGTLVNYRKVKKAVLKPGDKILMGRVILKFEYKDLADQKFFDEIYRLATVDGLTSLLNKAAILRHLSDEVLKLRRYKRRLAVIILDIDNFKSLNDTYGHLIGDRAIQAAADILGRNLRKQDKAGRFGGEEFLLVLPETGLRGASSLAERMRAEMEQTVGNFLSLPRLVTSSFGVASFGAHVGNAETLLCNADAALYRAKAEGKNRVACWRPAPKADPAC